MISLEYTIGLRGDESSDVMRAYNEARQWPDTEPEKHEFCAYLLMMAMRKEWADAEYWRRVRTQRRAKRERREQG